MEFEESAIEKDIRSLARKFAQSELAPLIDADEEEEKFRPELIQKLGKLGLSGISTSEVYEGMGLGTREMTVALEEIAKVSVSYAISVAVSALPQGILEKFGTEEQKRKYIPELARGDVVGAFSLSEVTSGSDAASLRTTAQKKGDYYLLNGTKFWTTQGDSAKTIIVMARTGEPGPKGISSFILEKGMPGFTLGKREKKMGAHTSHTMELILQDVKIPTSHLVGKEGDGLKVALTALDNGRINIGACANGISTAALEIATRYASERTQFGKPIGEFQGVSFLLAERATELEASKLLVARAAYLKDAGQSFTLEAAMAKLFATDSAMRATVDAVQVLGGAGYTREFPLERYMREAKVLQIVEGTNQIQKWVIGRNLLKNIGANA